MYQYLTVYINMGQIRASSQVELIVMTLEV